MGLAILSGLLLTASFPKFGVSIIAWLALTPLLFAIRSQSTGERFRLGMTAGLVHYLTLLYWLTHTMQTFGGMPLPVSIGILFLLAAYLSLYVGGFAVLLGRFASTPMQCLVMVPICWVALEYVRAYAISGFPWELLGYSQYQMLPIIQISDIFGVYGVSFLVAFVNGSFFLTWLYLRKATWQGKTVGRRTAAGSVAAAVLLLGLSTGYGLWRIHAVDRMSADAPVVKAAVIQGNIPQDVKWDKAFETTTIDAYLRLSRQAAAEAPDLVVWPETAAPFYFLRNEESTKRVLDGLGSSKAFFLIGSPAVDISGDNPRYFNTAYLMNPEGILAGRYDKSHLVPFGEYVPCKTLLPFVSKLVEGIGDFSPGKKGDAIRWGDRRLGIQICYEMVFPSLSRKAVKNGADLLINITNDAWYGNTSAPYQLFSMAVLRAVENRRSVVRSANTGISGFIDPVGRVRAKTPLFQEAAVTYPLPMPTIQTIYTRWGDFLPAGCLIWVLWLVLKAVVPTLISKKKEKKNHVL